MRKIYHPKSGKTFSADATGNFVADLADGKFLQLGAVKIYIYTSAITANVTTTALPAGTLALTSHATGAGTFFKSDGAKWQLS